MWRRSAKWRRRFAASRLSGLKDAPRSGRPPVFTAPDRAEVIALACALPAETGVPLARWSGPELARELAPRLPGSGLSAARLYRRVGGCGAYARSYRDIPRSQRYLNRSASAVSLATYAGQSYRSGTLLFSRCQPTASSCCSRMMSA